LNEDFDKVNNLPREHICNSEGKVVPAYAIFQEQ